MLESFVFVFFVFLLGGTFWTAPHSPGGLWAVGQQPGVALGCAERAAPLTAWRMQPRSLPNPLRSQLQLLHLPVRNPGRQQHVRAGSIGRPGLGWCRTARMPSLQRKPECVVRPFPRRSWCWLGAKPPSAAGSSCPGFPVAGLWDAAPAPGQACRCCAALCLCGALASLETSCVMRPPCGEAKPDVCRSTDADHPCLLVSAASAPATPTTNATTAPGAKSPSPAPSGGGVSATSGAPAAGVPSPALLLAALAAALLALA